MREGLFDHHRLDVFSMTVPGGLAVAQKAWGPVPDGYAWYLEVLAYTVIGNSHTAILDVAVTPDNGDLPTQALWDHAGLVWTTPAAATIRFSQNLNPPVYVGPNHWVRAYASGGSLAAADVVAVTFQFAVHQLDPHWMMSPEDTKQVKEAHERLGAELNMDAVGTRAN